MLTSGTTGTPKGAARSVPRSLGAVGAVLERVPFRTGQTVELCAPMFHSLGFATMMFGIGMGDTLVVRRRFSPEATLRSVERHRADNLVVVPVMLQRMLDDPACDEVDLSSLSVVFVGGSQLGSALCTRALRRLGPVLYNLYGSTEVAYASIATPDDLALSPATVGRVLRGSVVRILDDEGRPVRTGTTGRIFVGNSIQFDGYTGGGSKDVVDGLMSSGDVGHFDEHGLLYVDGRDDDMVISGGENVYPREVEELLEQHPDVVECAVVSVADERFGQRLRRAWCSAREPPGTRRASSSTSASTSRATRPRATWCSSTSAAQPDRQGAPSRAHLAGAGKVVVRAAEASYRGRTRERRWSET